MTGSALPTGALRLLVRATRGPQRPNRRDGRRERPLVDPLWDAVTRSMETGRSGVTAALAPIGSELVRGRVPRSLSLSAGPNLFSHCRDGHGRAECSWEATTGIYARRSLSQLLTATCDQRSTTGVPRVTDLDFARLV
jgi:hypothetical protein